MIGAALPWVPLVLVLWLVVAVTRRMRRRARPAVPTAGTAQQDDEERQPEPVG